MASSVMIVERLLSLMVKFADQRGLNKYSRNHYFIFSKKTLADITRNFLSSNSNSLTFLLLKVQITI